VAGLFDAEVARRQIVRRAPVEIDAAWDFAQQARFRNIPLRVVQVKSEFFGLLSLLRERSPKRIVEIGTLDGGTLFLLARAATQDAHIVSVDMPAGQFGGGYPRSHTRFVRSLALPSQTVDLIRGDSHAAETVNEVWNRIGGSADLLFIDGDHSLDGVRADFESYRGLVKGGLIAFHDIVPAASSEVGGVPEFWAAIKDEYPHVELVEDWDQGGYGIGVLSIESE
jgi:predicted O-methyltransferase YrrM